MKKTTFFTIIFLLFTASYSHAIRAGLDFTFIAHEDGRTETITCDICDYHYKNSKVGVSTLSVSARDGFVEIYFLPLHGEKSGVANINTQEAVKSKHHEFEVDYFQKAKVKEGQIVRLKGTNIKFELVKAFGLGCPPGMRCMIKTEVTV